MSADETDIALPSFVSWQTIRDGRLVRLIYADEAGTGPAEPVRVVAAVVVQADEQAQTLIREMEQVYDECVLPEYREGFIFHAKDLFSPSAKKNKYPNWNFEDRLDFIKAVTCLPFIHDVPIALGSMRKGTLQHSQEVLARLRKKKLGPAAVDHAMAFASCLERADLFLRKYLDGKEKGLVIAEDVNEKRVVLRRSGLMFREKPLQLSSETMQKTRAQEVLGEEPEGHHYTITNILDVPHFLEKADAPLLQLADACAFAFRRYLSGFKYGEDLILAMLGPEEGGAFIEDPVWRGEGSSGLFNTRKYWTDEQVSRSEEMRAQLILARVLGKVMR